MKNIHKYTFLAVVSMFLVGCGGGSSSGTSSDIPTTGEDPVDPDGIDLTTIIDNEDIAVIKFVSQEERDRAVDWYLANVDPNASVFYEDMNCSSLDGYALVEDDVKLGGEGSPTGVLVDTWYKEGILEDEHHWCREYTYLPGTSSNGELIFGEFFVTIAGIGSEDSEAFFFNGHIDGIHHSDDDNGSGDGNGNGNSEDNNDTYPSEIDLSLLVDKNDITVVRNINEAEKNRIINWYLGHVDPESLVFESDLNCSSLEGYILAEENVRLGGKSKKPGVTASTWYMFNENDLEDPYYWCNEYTYSEGVSSKGDEAYGLINIVIAGEGNKNSRAIFHDGHLDRDISQ